MHSDIYCHFNELKEEQGKYPIAVKNKYTETLQEWKTSMLSSVENNRIVPFFTLTHKGHSEKKKIDVEYLHIDYSLNCVTAVLHNVIVHLKSDSTERLSDLVPRLLICSTFWMCQIENSQSKSSLCLHLLSDFTAEL